jgi:UDP-N-acetyl-D-glucosamine/UDP-N-acetyl-D-galactosamine dehydrogenase
MSVVAVIGLGYVGLPLVVEFGKHVRTIGFDIAVPKVEACLRGTDACAAPTPRANCRTTR